MNFVAPDVKMSVPALLPEAVIRHPSLSQNTIHASALLGLSLPKADPAGQPGIRVETRVIGVGHSRARVLGTKVLAEWFRHWVHEW